MASAPTLAPNLIPPGTQGAGSLISVVDHWAGLPFGNISLAVPISSKAKAGDLIILAAGWGGASGFVPANVFSGFSDPANFWIYFGTASGLGTYPQLTNLYFHVVDDGEPNTHATLGWSQTVSSQQHFSAVTFRGVWIDTFLQTLAQRVSFAGTAADTVPLTANAVTSYLPGCIQYTAFHGTPGNATQGAVFAFGGVNFVDTDYNGNIGNFMAIGANDLPLATTPGYARSIEFGNGSPAAPVACAATVINLILPPVQPPDPPDLSIDPVGPTLDTNAGFTINFPTTQKLGLGPTQAVLIHRQRQADGSKRGYLNLNTMSWQQAEYWIATAADNVYVPPGVWPNDLTRWDLHVAVAEANYGLQSSLAHTVLTAAAKPVVAVTSPTGSSTSSTPPVNWTVTFALGGTVTQWQVKIFSSDQYLSAGFDPDATTARADSQQQAGSATTWTPSALRGSAYYKAYVKVWDSLSGSSVWTAGSEWYANYATMATPTLVATADTDPITGAPRAKVVVTTTDAAALSGSTYVNLFRFDPVTDTNVAVRFAQGVAIPWPAQTVTLYDYEMPPNVATDYSAQTYSTYDAAFIWDDVVHGLWDNAGDLFV